MTDENLEVVNTTNNIFAKYNHTMSFLTSPGFDSFLLYTQLTSQDILWVGVAEATIATHSFISSQLLFFSTLHGIHFETDEKKVIAELIN